MKPIILIIALCYASSGLSFSLQDVEAELSLNDLEYKRTGSELSIDWGLDISNTNRDNYTVQLTLEHTINQYRDHSDNTLSKDNTYNGALDFELNSIFHYLGLVTHASIEEQIHIDRKRNSTSRNLTPLGAKIDFYRKDWENYFNISIHPQLNYARYCTEEFDSSFNYVNKCHTSNSWFYGVRAQLSLTFSNDKFELKGDHWLKTTPGDIGGQFAERGNRVFTSENSISYSVHPYLALGYRFELDYDERRKIEQGLPSTDIVNGITVSLTWN